MFESGVLYSKVINDEAKHDGACFVAEEAVGVFALVVSVFGKMGDKGVIG